MTPQEQLKEKIYSLQDSLLSNHPLIPVLLRDIHTKIKSDPELVLPLTEEELNIIFSGLKYQTKTELVTSTVKSKPTTASLKKLSADDL